jgi:hypothetical protein
MKVVGLKVGLRVRVDCGNPRFDGKLGTVTSIDERLVLPVHVTIDGEKSETDFREDELFVVREEPQQDWQEYYEAKGEQDAQRLQLEAENSFAQLNEVL